MCICTPYGAPCTGWQDWPLTAGREEGYQAGTYGNFKTRGTYPESLLQAISDIFVKDGIQLNRMYSPSTCAPSRRALFTGRDFQQHNVHNNDCPALPLNMKILPAELDRAGYDVGFYGKWHLGEKPVRPRLPRSISRRIFSNCLQGSCKKKRFLGTRV